MTLQTEEQILDELRDAERFAKTRKRLLLEKKKEMEKFRDEMTTTEKDALSQFRSYQPLDSDLGVATSLSNNLEDQLHLGDELIKDDLELGKEAKISDELDLSELQPKKIDWDLKRDIENDMAILNKRTERAICYILMKKYNNQKEVKS
uniref:Cactin_mid domain-containing protein n=1 Tax=Strongyloides venezuelensis TaxID=75913 RepID=A0A0K0G2I4_STRVS